MRERWRMATTMWQRTDRTKEKGRRVDVVFEWLFFFFYGDVRWFVEERGWCSVSGTANSKSWWWW
ncbi:hypothetical protein HanXRQr2_Chr07g0315191 [Helianthus annuus]|uniref:Uncharacterized protein n=1 Tax=Helianthus annuus TaxID=4232 RepID=A0A9K3NH79_HELAN|nr:hypothetical protein HanXRQr2_Chr07g0315191 [Helianthus annuus]